MWEEIARLLKIRNDEDFFGKRMGLTLLMTLFFVFLSLQGHRIRILSHLILLSWISLNANQMVSLFRRKGCAFIELINARSERNKFWTLVYASVVENLYYLLLLMLQLLVFFKGSLGTSLVITLLHFSFALALGILTSQMTFMNIGFISLITYYLGSFFMATAWTFDENWRFFSLTLQLNQVKWLNQSNTLSLAVIAIGMMMLGRLIFANYKIKWKPIAAVVLAGIVILGILINYELDFNRRSTAMAYLQLPKQSSNGLNVYYKALDSSQIDLMITVVSTIVHEMEKYYANDLNVERIYFDKYYIAFVPNLYKKRPIPVAIDDKGLKINVFSDAMLNCEEPEVFSEMVNRINDHLERSIPNISNPYVYQIVIGNHEFIQIAAYQSIGVEDREALISEEDRIIKRRKEAEPTASNYVKKIMIVMREQYPDKMPLLYQVVQETLPETPADFEKVFEAHFPELTKDQAIMTLVRFR